MGRRREAARLAAALLAVLLAACGKDAGGGGAPTVAVRAVDAAPVAPAWQKGLYASRWTYAALAGEPAVVIGAADTDVAQLTASIKAPAAADAAFVVAADAGATHGVVMGVLRKAREAGWTRLALAVATPRGPGVFEPYVPSLQDQIDEAKGEGVRVGPGVQQGRRGDGISMIAPSGGRAPPRPDPVPKGSLRLEKPELDWASETLDGPGFSRKVQSAYQSGMIRCYKDALKVDPGLKGRVTLELTIAPSGVVSRAEASGFDAGMDACLSSMARRWRFPSPGDEPLTVVQRIAFVTEAGDEEDPLGSGGGGGGRRGPSVRQLPPAQPVDDGGDAKLVVMIAKDRVVLFSMSGLEGTLNAPRWSGVAAADGLGAVLVEIAARRCKDGVCPPIVVMAADDVPVGVVLGVIDAVAYHGDEQPLFRRVMLGRGFD